MHPRIMIIILGGVTLVFFPIAGHFVDLLLGGKGLSMSLLQKGAPFFIQLIIGGLFGLAAGLMAWQLIQFPFMKPVRNKYGELISQLGLQWPDVIFISFCAGFGEELLFRASLQPHFGLWITSIGFVALHGYLNPKDWRVSVYGVFMTLVILFIGWMYSEIGIISAISAHMVIDVVLLARMTQNR